MTLTDSPLVMRLRGRLGNHLFQYALGRALTPYGPVVVDDIFRSADPLTSLLVPGSVRLLTSAEALALRQPPRFPRGRVHLGNAIQRLPRGWFRSWLEGREFHETTEAEFDHNVQTLTGPTVICGYFQNEAYFSAAADRVAASFRPPDADGIAALQRFRVFAGNGDTVAVVIRAGLDYEQLGWTLPFSWYRRAAEEMAGLLESPRFAVFSDVPLAAEAAAKALHDIGPGEAVTRLSPRAQLDVISRLDHAIIASSSFGWWGAWLGDYHADFDPGRVVIAPHLWIRPDLDQTPSPRWRRLP